jgi:hypothetical protein
MANTKPINFNKSLTLKVDAEFLAALERVRNLEKPARNKSDTIRKAIFDLDKKAKRK